MLRTWTRDCELRQKGPHLLPSHLPFPPIVHFVLRALIYYRLYEDIDAILVNVILNKQRQDRESGYGGSYASNNSSLHASL